MLTGTINYYCMQYNNCLYFQTNSYAFQFTHMKNNQVIALSNYSQSLQKRIPPSKLNHASAVVLKDNHCFDLIIFLPFMLLRVLIILREKFVFNIWIFIIRDFVVSVIDLPDFSCTRRQRNIYCFQRSCTKNNLPIKINLFL